MLCDACKTVEVCEMCGKAIESNIGAEIGAVGFFAIILSFLVYLVYNICKR